MSDLISRQAAIIALEKRTGIDWKSLKILVPMLEVLEELPSTEPETQWIPVTERMPEKYQMVLTTIKGVDLFRECAEKNFFEAIETAQKRTLVSVGILEDDGWYGTDGSLCPMSIEPIAWMPLPEAYGGQEDE